MHAAIPQGPSPERPPGAPTRSPPHSLLKAASLHSPVHRRRAGLSLCAVVLRRSPAVNSLVLPMRAPLRSKTAKTTLCRLAGLEEVSLDLVLNFLSVDLIHLAGWGITCTFLFRGIRKLVFSVRACATFLINRQNICYLDVISAIPETDGRTSWSSERNSCRMGSSLFSISSIVPKK